MSSLSPLEQAKQRAAHRAVNEHIKTGMNVGIGSGSTVVYAVERLVERVKSENLQITCVPSSFQATQLIVDGGLVLSDLTRTPSLDVAIDGADEVDSSLNCIKGGGACMLQEKIIISCAKKFVVIADYRKDSKQLGQQVGTNNILFHRIQLHSHSLTNEFNFTHSPCVLLLCALLLLLLLLLLVEEGNSARSCPHGIPAGDE